MLICLSASHKNSSFDLLERLSVDAEQLGRRIVGSHDSLGGAVVVATCNRFEAYLDLDEPEGTSPLAAVSATLEAVAAESGVSSETLRESLALTHGNSVAEHLFAVSAGLESVVVGEGEIAGQVRRSLERARTVGTTTPELERLFQRASQTSRGIKNRTGIGSAGRSLVRLALDLAESRIPDWSTQKVLLIGTGRYAGASLANLRERGVTDVQVYSPSGRGRKFAANHDLPAISVADYPAAAASADVIVACSAVEAFVLTADDVRTGRDAVQMLGRAVDSPARQLVIDLGLPRNIDPAVGEIDGISLLDLETIRLHAPLDELTATDEARAIVGKAARKFGKVSEEINLAPAVVALRTHVLGIVEDEIARARARGDDSAATEQALRHLAGVLLHTPMVRSREYVARGEQRTWIDGVEAIFGVVPEVATAASVTAVDDSADDEDSGFGLSAS
ncbi:glutamyl-tRNA reductase [Orlajensenia leifsoniae]|uniref:Glutamyl-tRNA reductase n=1 Tax=Orlajensenia leifsoniae TaxID=2561933 RepID=A0A4Y9R3N1_9MICO|nr:glutamyl-tRNA reductase [Leifsonia flava]TFV98166.1 glutamyl-tRNA reductase [Leifsonia flava]